MADIPINEHIRLNDGSQIKNLRAGINDPSGEESLAVIRYVDDAVNSISEYQYFNGTAWIPMKGTGEDFTTALKEKLTSISMVKKEDDPLNPSPYASVYELQVTIGAVTSRLGDAINIPKDMVLKSGSVGTVTVAGAPYPSAVVGDAYIDLELANATNDHIYIPANSLVSLYSGDEPVIEAPTKEVVIEVDNSVYKISAYLNTGAIALGKLKDIVLGVITGSTTQVSADNLANKKSLLSILQTFASNLKFLLENSYVSPYLTGTSGTITKTNHKVNNPKSVIFTIDGVTGHIYTKIDPTSKNLTWTSQTNFTAPMKAVLTIIG